MGSSAGPARLVPRGLPARLASFDPDALVVGGASVPALLCASYARPRGKPVYIWWAGTGPSERSRSLWHALARRWLFRRVEGFLAYGEEAAAYLQGRGVEGARIAVMGNNTRDAKAYAALVDAAKGGGPPRAGFALLCVAQLIERKNVAALIEAWSRLELRGREARLEIVGTGPLARRLRERAAARGSRGVCFSGAVEAGRMPGIYARADALACPSLVDQWPQVVNEAMAAGLPVVVSTGAGVDRSFASDGETGFRVDPADPGALAGALQRLVDDPALARRLGAAARGRALARDAASAAAVVERFVGGPGAAAAAGVGRCR